MQHEYVTHTSFGTMTDAERQCADSPNQETRRGVTGAFGVPVILALCVAAWVLASVNRPRSGLFTAQMWAGVCWYAR